VDEKYCLESKLDFGSSSILPVRISDIDMPNQSILPFYYAKDLYVASKWILQTNDNENYTYTK